MNFMGKYLSTIFKKRFKYLRWVDDTIVKDFHTGGQYTVGRYLRRCLHSRSPGGFNRTIRWRREAFPRP